MLVEYRKRSYRDNVLRKFSYYKDLLNVINAEPSAPAVEGLHVEGYRFWCSYVPELERMEVDESVRYLFIEYLDRGIANFEVFGKAIKRVYPNLTEMYIDQTYSFRDESDTWGTFETFFVNLDLSRLIVGMTDYDESVIINDQYDTLDKITDIFEELNNVEMVPGREEFWYGGDQVSFNLDIVLNTENHRISIYQPRED